MSEQYVWILSFGSCYEGGSILNVFKTLERGKKEFYSEVEKHDRDYINCMFGTHLYKETIIEESDGKLEAIIGNDYVKLIKWKAE